MDALAPIIVAAIMAAASVAVAVVTGRNSADRLRLEDQNRRYARKLDDLGVDPDDV